MKVRNVYITVRGGSTVEFNDRHYVTGLDMDGWLAYVNKYGIEDAATFIDLYYSTDEEVHRLADVVARLEYERVDTRNGFSCARPIYSFEENSRILEDCGWNLVNDSSEGTTYTYFDTGHTVTYRPITK